MGFFVKALKEAPKFFRERSFSLTKSTKPMKGSFGEALQAVKSKMGAVGENLSNIPGKRVFATADGGRVYMGVVKDGPIRVFEAIRYVPKISKQDYLDKIKGKIGRLSIFRKSGKKTVKMQKFEPIKYDHELVSCTRQIPGPVKDTNFYQALSITPHYYGTSLFRPIGRGMT